MNRRLAGSMLLAFLLLALPARGGENERLVLVRSSFGSGATGENAHIRLTVAETVGFMAVAPGSSLVALHQGFLAPATDRAGLIDRNRMVDIILGRAAAVEPIAADFAGNRDGRIDVADLVTIVNKQLP